MHGLPQSMRVLVVGGQREELDGPARRSTELLHSEDAPGYCPRRPSRAEPHVCRPCRIPVQERSILLERFHSDREAAGRPYSDGGLMLRTGVCTALALVSISIPAAAQEKQPPYWASIASGQ